MNKLYKALATQATEWCEENAQGTPVAWEWEEKFAELIVKECLEACDRANEIRHFVPPTQEQVVLNCMREIEEHFGIKE